MQSIRPAAGGGVSSAPRELRLSLRFYRIRAILIVRSERLWASTIALARQMMAETDQVSVEPPSRETQNN
jgi:hypothetical protein